MDKGFPREKILKAKALSAVRSGEIDTGIENYKSYLEKFELDDDAWSGLGGAYRRKGDIEQAIKSYERAYEINDQSTYAIVNIVSLCAARNTEEDLEKLRRYLPDAIRLIERKIESNKDDFWTWYDLATMQLIEREPEKALKTFSYAAELTPQTAKENFRSVLNNLYFLKEHNPGLPEISTAIEIVERHL